MTISTVKIDTQFPNALRAYQQSFDDLDVKALIMALNQGQFSLKRAGTGQGSGWTHEELGRPAPEAAIPQTVRPEMGTSFPQQSAANPEVEALERALKRAGGVRPGDGVVLGLSPSLARYDGQHGGKFPEQAGMIAQVTGLPVTPKINRAAVDEGYCPNCKALRGDPVTP